MSAFFAKTETVIGVDSDEGKIRQLCQGNPPIFEPEIESWLRRNRGNLTFTTDFQVTSEKADFIFIMVDTPNLADGSQDLSNIKDVIQKIYTHERD